MICHCTNRCHCDSTGIGIGTLVAVLISWMKWESIGWAIVHGVFGWFYVLYYFFAYGIDSL